MPGSAGSEKRVQALVVSGLASLRSVPRLLPSVIAAAFIVILHAVTLRRFPPAFVDEAWMASRAWGWLNTGLNFGILDAGVHDQLDGYWTFFPVTPTLVHAFAIQLFGLSLTALRITSLVFGLGLLLGVYVITWSCTRSRRAGLIAVVLLATSYPFIYSAHLVRPDILVAALGFGAIALNLAFHPRDRFAPGLASGLLLGIAFEVHANSAIYGPVILALYVADYGWGLLSRRQFWGLVAGLGIGVVLYSWLHLLRYPDTVVAMGGNLGRTHLPPLVSGRLQSLIDGFLEMGYFLLVFSLGRILAGTVAGISLWRNRVKMGRRPLLMCITGLLSFAVLVRNKPDYYAILIWPFVDIVLAVWIEWLLRSGNALSFWNKRTKAFGYVTMAMSMLILLVVTATAAPPGDVDRVAGQIRQEVPRDDSIMGPQTYWFGLTEHRYLSWQQLLNYASLHPGSTLEEAFRALAPDSLLLDDHLRRFILPDQEKEPTRGFARYVWERRLPKEEFEAFLACRGQLADSIDTKAYGVVEIYRIDWSEPNEACS